MIPLLLSLALAQCPTSATPSTLTIEAQAYGVQGYANRTAMRARLERSGCDAVAFDEWRRQVRRTRGTAIAGAVVWPVWIATAVHWSRAVRVRSLLISQSHGEVGP